MVKIKRGDHETVVSMESYKNIFKPLGYTLEEKEEPKKVVEVAPKKIEVSVKDTKRKKKQED